MGRWGAEWQGGGNGEVEWKERERRGLGKEGVVGERERREGEERGRRERREGEERGRGGRGEQGDGG